MVYPVEPTALEVYYHWSIEIKISLHQKLFWAWWSVMIHHQTTPSIASIKRYWSNFLMLRDIHSALKKRCYSIQNNKTFILIALLREQSKLINKSFNPENQDKDRQNREKYENRMKTGWSSGKEDDHIIFEK